MFGWNPFKKQRSPATSFGETVSPPGEMPHSEMPHSETPESETPDATSDLLTEIVNTRDDSLRQDLRPLQRFVRDTTFLLPLHEPPIQSAEGTKLRYITFEENDVMCAFTDEARMRDFFRGFPKQDVVISYQTGKTLCQIAEYDELRKIILNPNADISFALPPMIYRTIASGLVMGHFFQGELPQGQIAMGHCVAGMPGMDALDAFRVTLGQFGATEAWWAALFLPPDEMRFCLGVAAPQRAFEALPDQLVQAWIGRWPLPTPLYVFALDGTNPERDDAFRLTDRVL